MVAMPELTVDDGIRVAVLRVLHDDPEIAAANIGVEVVDGSVRLTGAVDTVDQGLEAECDVMDIPSVRRVLNDLEVRGSFAL